MARLFKSAAFRLTLLYVMTFGISVTLLLVFIYFKIVASVEVQLRHDINVQLADLGRKFIVDGPDETAAQIKHLLKRDQDRTLVLMLLKPDKEIMAGNLTSWPGGKKNWLNLALTKKNSKATRRAIAINSILPGGYILMVGRKLDQVDKVRRVISDVLYVCFGLTFILALAGGFLLTRTIQRRLEVINQACGRVMSGELSTRVTVTGGADEFDHLAENINLMLTRICELIDGVRDISYNVAHDLRTPLNRLRNRLEVMLQTKGDPAKAKEDLRGALMEVDGLVATFNAILRISQAEMGAGIEHFQSFDLSTVVGDVVDLYRPVAEEKPLTMESEIVPGIMCHGDRHLMTQALANIVDNAIKYTPVNGRMRITLATESDKILLCVDDTGPGIPAEFHPKVIEKFFRMESSRSSPGNGLGLSLVNAAIRLHGGLLSFVNLNPGLRVKIELPR